MSIILISAAVVAAILIFELAALRWGHDSRDDFRFNNRENIGRPRR